MMLGLVITLLGAASQSDALFSGPVPREAPTFEVVISGQTPFHAGIRIGGQWVTDRSMDIKPTQTIECVPDIPLYSYQPVEILKRHVTLNYEAPAMRRARLERQWEELGYTIIETAAGWRPVKKDDILLAERARQLASAEPPVIETPAADAHPATETAGARWSPAMLLTVRITIIMAGVVVAFLIVWLMLRR